MKRSTVLSSLGLILLFAAAPADANLECLMAGQIAFVPAHPGVGEQITYKASLSVAQITPPSGSILNRTVVTGNTIEVDFVVSDDLSPFPEYTLADPTPSIATGTPLYGGSVGALALGQYAVTINIGEYRSVDGLPGFQKNTCGGPYHANLVVESYPAPTQKREVVEYRNQFLDRYFITQNSQEIAALDSGLIGGWSRTGLQFLAYLPGLSDGRGVPITRLFKASSVGHLFTLMARETESLTLPDPVRSAWQVEASDAFEIPMPSVLSGACTDGTVPVYRLWDGRVDGDHRYTADRGVRDQMIQAGYVVEGFGPDAVFFCAIGP